MSRWTIANRNVIAALAMAACIAIPISAQTTKPAKPSVAKPSPAGWASTNPSSPVAPGAKLEKLGDGFEFTEGPTSDEKGNIFFIDQPTNRILEWTTDGKVSTWMHPCGHSNGMCFDRDGNLIACADEMSQLWSIAPDKKVTVLVKDFNGKLLNGPNDVWIRPDGGMYITDPFYKRDWWKQRGTKKEQETEGVYYLTPDRKTPTRVISDFERPNGIIGTPDGKTLYASDIQAGKTFSYSIQEDGSLKDKKLFNHFGSDGMTLDSDGNVYTTSKGAVQICDKAGNLLDTIPVNGANCCFGGTDGHLLFITARKEIYGLKMKTQRVGPQ